MSPEGVLSSLKPLLLALLRPLRFSELKVPLASFHLANYSSVRLWNSLKSYKGLWVPIPCKNSSEDQWRYLQLWHWVLLRNWTADPVLPTRWSIVSHLWPRSLAFSCWNRPKSALISQIFPIPIHHMDFAYESAPMPEPQNAGFLKHGVNEFHQY